MRVGLMRPPPYCMGPCSVPPSSGLGDRERTKGKNRKGRDVEEDRENMLRGCGAGGLKG